MTLRNENGDVLSRAELLALTTDVTPPVDPILEVNARVYETFTEEGATEHEGGRRLRFADGQRVRQSEIDNMFATATVTNIAPATGPAVGGTAVTITGTDLAGVEGVTFAGVAATDVTVVDDDTVTCTTPAGAVGPADVVVLDDGGNVTVAGGFTYA